MFLGCDVSWWVAVVTVFFFFSFFPLSCVAPAWILCPSFPHGLVFSRFLQDLCALFLSFRFPLLLPVAALLVLLSFLSSRDTAECAKGAGWVAGVQKVLSLFWVHPASPVQSTSSSALTSNTVRCQRVLMGSWSWQRGRADQLHGQLLTSLWAVSKLSPQGQNKIGRNNTYF